MIVIHALWQDGLLLWGEDSSAPRSAGRSRAHPSAATSERLIAVLPPGSTTDAIELVLPTRGRIPSDSPELVREEPPTDRGTLTLAPWRVPVVRYGADDALGALAAISIPADGADEVVPGASTRHLCAVAGFAADLVSRGRLLPTVEHHDGMGRALWRPVLTGADVTWAQALVLALPPAARAAGVAGPSVVAEALDALVDAAARTAISAAGVTLTNGWTAALTGVRRTFASTPDKVTRLAEALAVWQRDAVTGRVRACFRLDRARGGRSGHWRLDFALQAADQPSLLVDADRVWGPRGSLKALSRHLDSPQETLLAELGRASRLYPELDDALRTAKPAGLDLDATGAHRFLQQGAPMLAGAGFGVLLPGWWSKPRARLGARLSASSPTAPGTVATKNALGLESLVDYQWQLALGDEPLTEAELKTLTDLKAPLVRLRGQWVELDAKRLAAGLKMISTAGQMTVADLLHAGLSTRTDPAGLPVVSVTADGALGDLLTGQVERRLEPVPTPAGFTGRFGRTRNGVLPGSRSSSNSGWASVLADDMGLGKSATVLALLLHSNGDVRQPTLLVCPMSLVGNWQREVAKFAPELRVHVHHGAERAKGKVHRGSRAGADLVITTYALAARDAAALTAIAWHRVVVDEAQAIKNAATRQAVAVRGLPARHRIAVTGTPVENRLADLWSIMEFANPGCWAARSASRRGSPSRSSGAATRRRRSASAGSPARSYSGG